jgi:hypothetical protein
MRQERYAEAAELFARSAETYRRTVGENDLDRWRALANPGWAHLRSGQVSAGRGELAAAVTRIERLAGADSYELRQPLEQLGEALTAAGEAQVPPQLWPQET